MGIKRLIDNNPRPLDADALEAILDAAWHGEPARLARRARDRLGAARLGPRVGTCRSAGSSFSRLSRNSTLWESDGSGTAGAGAVQP